MTEVVSVRFRGGTKNYYFDPKGLTVEPGQYVVVETAQGIEYVQCVEGNHFVPDQAVIQPLRSVHRIATENDHRAAAYNRRREKEAFGICEEKIAAHGLEMKLVNVECSFEGNKIIFFFTAEGRVDFRELVKDLASVFRARIELRQIGVRDEAKMLGGIGICGRPLCCSQFLENFIPVSIKMAKTQNLSLNPTKISGACGRLMCCLKYEQNAYEDAAKRLPKSDSFVDTPDGIGNVSGVDMLREEVQVRLDSAPESPRRYKAGEIRVLRSGKGSREGIEIPKERPARCAPPEEKREEAWESRSPRRVPVIREPAADILSADEEEREEVRGAGRRRKRSGRRSGEKSKPAEKTAQPVKAEKARKAEKKAQGQKRSDKPSKQPGKVEKLPVRMVTSTTAEKKAAADRADAAASGGGEGQRRRRYRPRNRGGGRGGASGAE